MSDTKKTGKRSRMPARKPESPEVGEVVMARHIYGRTEKILRRCRKIWTRLSNKIRRSLDSRAVAEGMAEREQS